MNATVRITDPTLPRSSWQRSYADHAHYPPLVIPADLPAFTREYLAQLDTAITKAARDGCVSAESFHNAAAAYRQAGQSREPTYVRRMENLADHADRMAKLVTLDPRLYVAGTMWNHATDGTAKLMLHTYVTLLTEQAEKRS